MGDRPRDPPRPADPWAWARSCLRLACPHARRDVFADGHLGENRLPFHRLFLVPPDSPRSGGRVTDLADGASLALLPGSVTLLPIARRYRFEFARGLRLVGFHFRLEAGPGQDVLGEAVTFRQQRRPAVATAAWQALGLDSGDAWLRAEGILRGELGQLAVLAWDRIDAVLARERRWGAVLRLLDREHGPLPPVAALARAAGLSRTHFSRRFRSDFGSSPRAWRDRRLAERAVELLLSSPISVQDLATELGFADGFICSRFVRRLTGLSPTALRSHGPWGPRRR